MNRQEQAQPKSSTDNFTYYSVLNLQVQNMQDAIVLPFLLTFNFTEFMWCCSHLLIY